MSNIPKGQPVRLRILSVQVGYQGINKRGEDYTIYEISAARESGEIIEDKKLRSFEELKASDELQDLVVVPFKSEKHGVSYTLSRKNRKGGSQKYEELSARVEELAGKLQAVEAWIRQNAGGAAAAPAAQPVAAASQAHEEQRRTDLDERFGAAPPF